LFENAAIAKIANKVIENYSEPFIIAEIGANHKGDMDLAKQMIDSAVNCGVDAVKFQSWTPKSLIAKEEYDRNQTYNDSKKKHFDDETIRLAFEVAGKIKSRCMAVDFVYSEDGSPRVVEVSYGFVKEAYYDCAGYWTTDMTWHEGPFDAPGWMVENVVKEIEGRK
jgi:hypothetical protein